jgi:hypothetical protein
VKPSKIPESKKTTLDNLVEAMKQTTFCKKQLVHHTEHLYIKGPLKYSYDSESNVLLPTAYAPALMFMNFGRGKKYKWNKTLDQI